MTTQYVVFRDEAGQTRTRRVEVGEELAALFGPPLHLGEVLEHGLAALGELQDRIESVMGRLELSPPGFPFALALSEGRAVGLMLTVGGGARLHLYRPPAQGSYAVFDYPRRAEAIRAAFTLAATDAEEPTGWYRRSVEGGDVVRRPEFL